MTKNSAAQAAADFPLATNHDTPLEVVRLLDPSLIDPGSTPNRTPDSFEDEAMGALSLSISLKNGNQEPIHVRPLGEPRDGYEYALISGARRLHACKQHKLLVRVLVMDATPEQSLLERLVENHNREPLSPWELGKQLAHIKAQPDMNLSMRNLGALIGIDASMVQKALDIAALPNEVVQAFTSPKDIRYADAKKLKDLLGASRDKVIAKSLELKGQGLTAKQVLEDLAQAVQTEGEAAAGNNSEATVEPFNTPRQALLKVQGDVVGEIKTDKSGQLVVALQAPMSLLQQQALAQCVEQFIARKVMGIKPVKPEATSVDAATQTASVAKDKSVKTAANDGFGNEGVQA